MIHLGDGKVSKLKDSSMIHLRYGSLKVRNVRDAVGHMI